MTQVSEDGGGAGEAAVAGADGVAAIGQAVMDRQYAGGLVTTDRGHAQPVDDAVEALVETGRVTAEADTHLENAEERVGDLLSPLAVDVRLVAAVSSFEAEPPVSRSEDFRRQSEGRRE